MTERQRRAIDHLRTHAPLYPSQLAEAVGIAEDQGRELVDQLLALDLIQPFEPQTSISDVYILTRKGIDTSLGRQ
jgi:hypothetical protein